MEMVGIFSLCSCPRHTGERRSVSNITTDETFAPPVSSSSLSGAAANMERDPVTGKWSPVKTNEFVAARFGSEHTGERRSVSNITTDETFAPPMSSGSLAGAKMERDPVTGKWAPVKTNEFVAARFGSVHTGERRSVGSKTTDDALWHTDAVLSGQVTASAELRNLRSPKNAEAKKWALVETDQFHAHRFSETARTSRGMNNNNNNELYDDDGSWDHIAADGKYAHPATVKYEHSVLSTAKNERPAEVHPSHREKYLHDKQFEDLFQMRRQDFEELPKWKQANKKKELDLF